MNSNIISEENKEDSREDELQSYKDENIEVNMNGLKINKYYIPTMKEKLIPIHKIKDIKIIELNRINGRYTFFGFSWKLYYYNLDRKRPIKTHGIIIEEEDNFITIGITPDDTIKCFNVLKYLMKHMKNNKGITLIALVVTIIVLLILAGVSIAMLTGDNGILNRGQEASYQNAVADAKDQIAMKVAECVTNWNAKTYAGSTTVTISQATLDAYISAELATLETTIEAANAVDIAILAPNGTTAGYIKIRSKNKTDVGTESTWTANGHLTSWGTLGTWPSA